MDVPTRSTRDHLARPFRQAHKSGAYIYAVVEEVHRGFATVRMGKNGKGPRYTNLAVLGGEVEAGELVIMDYATSIPKVRPITEGLIDSSVPLETTLNFEISTYDPASIHAMYAYGDQEQEITSAGAALAFSSVKFDTGMFDAGVITIPTAGYYMFIAHAQVQGFPNYTGLLTWVPESGYYNVSSTSMKAFDIANSMCYAEIFIKSSVQGIFGYGANFSVDTKVSKPTFLEAVGIINAAVGELITVEVKSARDTLSSLVTAGIYPRLMGHRLNRDGAGSDQEGGAGDDGNDDQYPPPIDDSDIELDENTGYLHVSDTSNAYARAIAHMSDVSDCELLVKFTLQDNVDGGYLRFFLRASRDWYSYDRPTDGYEVAIGTNGGWYLAKIEDGVRSIYDSINTLPSLLPFYLRFQTSGDNIKAKIWLTTDTEPAWQLQWTNIPSLPAGTLQVGLFRIDGEHWAVIDDVNVHVP